MSSIKTGQRGPVGDDGASDTRTAHSPGPQTLTGISVLDLSEGVAGQFAARVLAEHGAGVLLVEPPEGSPTRHATRPDDRHLFWHLNTGKQSLVLERDTPAGNETLAKLVANADVVISDASDDLHVWVERHSHLVACSIRDFASSGPYATWKGSEMIHQALSGLMYSTGRADAAPLYGFGHRAYYSAGAAAVSAIVGALLLVQQGQSGQLLEINVHETAVAMSQNLIAQYSYNGSYPMRGPYPGACDIFQCSDGWASIYCRGDRWADMCAALGDPTLPDDPRFASIDVLLPNWSAAYSRLAPRVLKMSVDDFIKRVQSARGLAARVNSMADMWESEQLKARGFWQTIATPDGEQPLLGPLFRMSHTPRRVSRGAPVAPLNVLREQAP